MFSDAQRHLRYSKCLQHPALHFLGTTQASTARDKHHWFPIYFNIKIQGLSRTLKLVFNDQFSMVVCSMDSITAIFNIYFCDYGAVLVYKNKKMTIISKSYFGQNICLTKLLISHSLTWWIQGLSRTCGMKFKDFEAPILFSSTFKALNLGIKYSSTFKDAWEPCLKQDILQLYTSRLLLHTFSLLILLNLLVHAKLFTSLCWNLTNVYIQLWLHLCFENTSTLKC